ncbi:phosphatidylinositol-glycan biosynthesis class S protein [Myxozyma melibiosi]|uniref:Phosphatidylinositol-glycan biosynthesis class S protein n=1 Tax=Myxozyma melibiosi TaxID=54550 RepID=A0ABR1EYU3_9ASCO
MALSPEPAEAVSLRRNVVFSFWAVFLFLGLPLWYQTTAIHRTPLPLSKVPKLNALLESGLGLADHSLPIAVNLDSSCVADAGTVAAVNERLGQSLLKSSGDRNPAFTIKVRDKASDEQAHAAVETAYEADCTWTKKTPLPKTRISKTDKISIYIPEDGGNQVDRIVEGLESIFKADILFFNRHRLGSVEDAPGSILVKGSPYSEQVHFSFTLLVAYGQDSEQSLASRTDSVLDSQTQKSWRSQISALVSSLENSELSRYLSSITYDSDIGFQYISKSDADMLAGSTVTADQLSSLMDSFELQPVTFKSEDSAEVGFFQFIYLLLPDSEKTTRSRPMSFTIANWGGVILSPALEIASATKIFEKQIDKLLSPVSFILTDPTTGSTSTLRPMRHEFARIATITNLRAASDTLSALSHLVTSLKEMAVPQTVRDLFDSSFFEWRESVAVLHGRRRGAYNKVSEQLSLRRAAAAARVAKKAVFEKNMMLNMFVPFQHKVAVYLPLLGPGLVPLFISLKRVLKERRNQQ